MSQQTTPIGITASPVGRRRWGGIASRLLLIVPIAAFYIVFFLWPIATVVLRAFSVDGKFDIAAPAFTIDNFAKLFTDSFLLLIEGRTVLSYFNATNGNMEMRVAYDPTGLGTAPVTTVVFASAWPDPVDSLPPPEVNQLAQPYGGYISPGSTLDQVRVFISQWNTMARGGTPYRVIQYAVNPIKPWEQ